MFDQIFTPGWSRIACKMKPTLIFPAVVELANNMKYETWANRSPLQDMFYKLI